MQVSKAAEAGPQITYTYEQLLREKRGMERDVWAAALKPNVKYTIEKAEAAVAAYRKREVRI
jgi:hypothetical protein